MDIRGSRIVVLGGSGLVGMAIARELLAHGPELLVVSGLLRGETEAALGELRGSPGAEATRFAAEWGDIFMPHTLKDRRRAEILADPEARREVLDDLYGPGDADAVERSTLGRMLLEHRPGIVVDCINTATVFAYQNVYAGVNRLLERTRAGTADVDDLEAHLATLYLPQLIRHVQLMGEAMRRAGTASYLKIGTAGTGGMGLNIPFTHSEERPSRMLLAKSSLAGAHTLLLFLMARTPGGPAVKEIKPTAAISWKRIAHGEVVRGGRPIRRCDAAGPLALAEMGDDRGWRETGEPLHGVYLDAGENGLFSADEFEALTALGLMEFITPEEIARDAVREITGRPTGRDVVGALDAACSGPTYRAGVLRQSALAHMEALETDAGVRSVAYEMLGPPRLSKLLFEGAILDRLSDGDLARAASLEPEATARAATALVEDDADLRTRILSIGLPILLPDGERVLRGAEVKVRPDAGERWDAGRLAERGWVDLRPENWRRWRERLHAVLAERDGRAGAEGGSRWDAEPWERTGRIRPGALAAWIFRHEDGGERIKR
ncbi:MAG: short-chain dehydrogenase [Gemmatimonadota bacterium]|nr:short-chain dehydrogenase [Gemmatimonadota bacterium]